MLRCFFCNRRANCETVPVPKVCLYNKNQKKKHIKALKKIAYANLLSYVDVVYIAPLGWLCIFWTNYYEVVYLSRRGPGVLVNNRADFRGLVSSEKCCKRLVGSITPIHVTAMQGTAHKISLLAK